MKRIFLTFVFLTFTINCAVRQTETVRLESSLPMPVPTVSEPPVLVSENKVEETEDEPKYPGVSIDEEFPITAFHDFTEKDFKEKTYTVDAEDFQITVKNFAPKTISKNGNLIFNFKTLTPNDYSSNIVGVSQLLGEKSKEIYVVANGPGGVCCTNYWITDVSGKTPRSIFRSEDYGGFRNPMEVFDADGDGIYELVQFDSAFRYFLDDCGSCSPEPRAVFKYNKKAGKYLPAKGIQQDYEKEGHERWEKEIMDTFQKMKETNDRTLQHQLNREVRAYVVDLIYLGEENKAWQFFNKHFPEDYGKNETRAEIKNRLRQSKFYQALKKTS